MMMDISILGKEPILDKMAVLTITPLAPLSMVAEMPGSYYKTLSKPSKKMLCGLFENVLGWHFDLDTRKSIAKDVKQFRQKKKLQYDSHVVGSTYVPLLMDFFEIEGDPKIEMVSFCDYDDLWSRSYRREDGAKIHFNGTRFMNFDSIKEYKENRNSGNDEKWLTANMDKIPMFYATPTAREYIDFRGEYKYQLKLSSDLLDLLNDRVQKYNLGYLGNNDGWIDLKIVEL